MNKLKQEKRFPNCELCGIEKKSSNGKFCKSCGNRQRKLSKETKQKISENKERAKKISNSLKGRKKSKEHIKKIIVSRLANGTNYHTKETKNKISLLSQGNKNSNWKGGIKKELGYKKIYSPNHPNAKKNYMSEHRLIVEKYLGRYLTSKEVVHHINGIRDDNRIENLMLFENNNKHLSFHRKIQQFGITNPIKRQIENRWKELAIKIKKYPKEINIIPIKSQKDLKNLELF